MTKIAKKIEKVLTLQLAVPADMAVPNTDNALNINARTFTYYERADVRGDIDSITDAMDDGEPLALDVQDALDKASAPNDEWRVVRADLFYKYRERKVVVLRAGRSPERGGTPFRPSVALDDIGWIEYVFPIERTPDNESDEE